MHWCESSLLSRAGSRQRRATDASARAKRAPIAAVGIGRGKMKHVGIVPGGRPATARDVADLAGVSPMTVSRVLNGEQTVRPELRARVERAIQELGYTPNSAAKALAAAHPLPRMAFVFEAQNSAFLTELVVNGFGEATAANVQLVFARMPTSDDPARLLLSLKDRAIEGVLLPPPLCDDARLRLLLAQAGVRTVAIGCSDDDPTISTIGIDDRRAAYELTRHLIQLGHRRIGTILGHPRHRSSERRRAGYEAALVAHGIEPDRSLQWESRGDLGSAVAVVERALDAHPRVTALVAANDDIAAAVIGIVARGRGIEVPRSLSVCAFDDSEIASKMFPQLTTVRQPIAEMVRWGVRQLATELHALHDGQSPMIRKALLEHQLVYRDSDAPPDTGAL